MMVDKDVIGRTWPDKTITVERGALRFFAEATHEPDPIFSDEAAAKQAGHPALPVPPTYFFTLDLLAPADSFWLEDLGVDLSKVLHAEQSFEYDRLVYAGETVTIRTRISDAYDKKNGLLEFFVRDIEVIDAEQKRCALLKTTLVVRHG